MRICRTHEALKTIFSKWKKLKKTKMLITQKIINELTYNIIGACIEVHKLVGPGLYEAVYHKCLEKEFILRNIISNQS